MRVLAVGSLDECGYFPRTGVEMVLFVGEMMVMVGVGGLALHGVFSEYNYWTTVLVGYIDDAQIFQWNGSQRSIHKQIMERMMVLSKIIKKLFYCIFVYKNYNLLTLMKISREDFLTSKVIRIVLIDMEKKLMQHNRFVVEVTIDKMTMKAKKKYSELKRFGEEVEKKLGLKQLIIDKPRRSHQQYSEVESFLKRIHSILEDSSKDRVDEGSIRKRNQFRSYLYNMLFCDIQIVQGGSEGQQQTFIEVNKKAEGSHSSTSHSKEAKTDVNHETKESSKQMEKGEKRQSLKEAIRSIYRSRKDSEDIASPFKELMKQIKFLWVRQNPQKWAEKAYSLQDNILTLYSLKDHSKYIIPLANSSITLHEKDYTAIVTIYHSLSQQLAYEVSKAPLELRINDIFLSTHDKDHSDKYLSFYTKLKELAKVDKSKFTTKNIIKIRFNNKKLITGNKVEFEKKQAKQLVVKVSHQNYTFTYSSLIDTTTDILFPISNNYGKIEFDITESRELSLLPNLREFSMNLSVPVQNIYDAIYNERPKRKNCEIRTFYMDTKYSNYCISLDYLQRGNSLSYCIYDSNDKYEGEEPPSEFTRDQMRIQKNRSKRILYSIEHYANLLNSLKNFQYPLQSWVFYFITLLTILFFDANDIVLYTIFALLLVLAYNHPFFNSYIKELVIMARLNKFVEQALPQWKTQNFVPEYKIKLKKDVERIKFLHQFEMIDKKKRNIYKKYKRLQEVLLRGQVILTELVTISQKFKNLFGWYHHSKTKFLFFLLGVAFVGLLFIPLRIVFLFLLYKTMGKGLNYSKQTKAMNKVIVSQIFRVCIEENNLEDMKLHFTQKERVLSKNSVDYIEFQKKIKQSLATVLQIEYSPEIFTHAKTIGQMVELFSNCKKRLLIPIEICNKYGFNSEWSMRLSSLTKISLLIYGFIISVPSDRSILGVRREESCEKIEGSSGDEEED